MSPVWFLTLFLPSLGNRDEPPLLGSRVPGVWGITSADYHPLALNCQIFGPFFDHESAVQLLTSCPVWSPVRTVGPALSGLRWGHAPCSRAHKPFLLLLSLNLSCSSGDTRFVDTQVPPVNFRLFPALCLALAAPALGSWGAWEPSSEAAGWSSASLLPAPPSQRCSSTIHCHQPRRLDSIHSCHIIL